MQVISGEQVAKALPWPALVERIAALLRSGCEAPPRHHHSIERPGGTATMLLMPAWQHDGYIGVKMVHVFPQNADRGLPAISGLYLLCEGDTGVPLACIDGSELTRRRTAAASALAARYLAREDAGRLLMVGTGKLAPMLIEAHAAVRPIHSIGVWGRNPEKAETIAAEYRAKGFDCDAVTDLATAVSEADIVTCATLSTAPLVHGEWLRPGTHLDLVGAFRADMRESDDEAVRCADVFVDTHAGARGEAGDLRQAEASGAFDYDDIHADLEALARGEHPGRESADEITLFKSVGASLEDLAAAIEVWEQVGAPG
ncbi:ornithine cyclodeaminase family protein [Arhodomonas sp. AD133]|uniref:ornithine cyclodeaminase family protein n=1 Tax=Arhodomonas sp. AD133 TaxID=3415009 RepID=UPI003EBB5A60